MYSFTHPIILSLAPSKQSPYPEQFPLANTTYTFHFSPEIHLTRISPKLRSQQRQPLQRGSSSSLGVFWLGCVLASLKALGVDFEET